MARRRPKIPRTTAFLVPFELDSSDWERMEQAYGQTFSPQLRDEVVKITERFLYWASAEQTPPMREAQERAGALRKFKSSLLDEIQRKSDVGPYTDELIAVCFRVFGTGIPAAFRPRNGTLFRQKSRKPSHHSCSPATRR